MDVALIPPAETMFLSLPASTVYALIPIVGIAVFGYMLYTRIKPLRKAAPDARWGELGARVPQLIKIWLLQYRHPRYMLAGVLHILLFAGFLILGLRSTEMALIGIWPDLVIPGMNGWFGELYAILRSYAATWVLIVALIAMVRRGLVQPARYAVPEKYGKAHTGEAVFVLGMICTLVISESLFEASLVAAQVQKGMHAEFLAPATLAWMFNAFLAPDSQATLQWVHGASYFVHEITFFAFLCFLPLGKHFHVVTSLFNVWFMRLRRGNIKPVRYGISEAQLDDLDSFGVKTIRGFYLEAHFRFLLMCRLRSLFGQLSGQRGGPTAVARGLFPSKGATWPSKSIPSGARRRPTDNL
jgi:hypothetical protein